MTLDKHKIDGVPQITVKVLLAQESDDRLIQAGYSKWLCSGSRKPN